MSILLAKNSGFCFGVKRAIRLAQEASRDSAGKPIYTLGEIIHNPQIVQELESEGIRVARDLTELHNAVVIIRSHGIPRHEEELLQQQGCILIDATCPYVKRTHELASEMSREGYKVLICGDPTHPEVVGMLSYAEGAEVVKPGNELCLGSRAKVALICQTTQKLENLQDVVQKLVLRVKELRVFNTICLATTERQDSTRMLAQKTDLMIIIGGHHSSNTRMLHSICSKETLAVHIETEAELDEELIRRHTAIGLSAGASTPDDMIVRVYNKIKQIKGEAELVSSISDIPTFKEESC
ncbi:MAG: 4-hydroxy-3-methylbut-2-enyl diphosphate reductase [Candidatus Cloacimonadota bacterium]